VDPSSGALPIVSFREQSYARDGVYQIVGAAQASAHRVAQG
jgi:hypothetical protein